MRYETAQKERRFHSKIGTLFAGTGFSLMLRIPVKCCTNIYTRCFTRSFNHLSFWGPNRKQSNKNWSLWKLWLKQIKVPSEYKTLMVFQVRHPKLVAVSETTVFCADHICTSASQAVVKINVLILRKHLNDVMMSVIGWHKKVPELC